MATESPMSLMPAQAAVPRLDGVGLVERICLITVPLIAGIELLGWLLPGLGAHLPAGWQLMKFNTALGALLATGGLWLSVPERAAWQTRAMWAALAMLMSIAFVGLVEHATGTISGLDTLFAADAASPKPGMMSAQTAIGFLLLAGLLPLSRVRGGLAGAIADGLALALSAFVFTLLAGYIFGAARLFEDSPDLEVSSQTLLCFVLLAAALIGRRTVGGLLSVLVGAGIGSRIARIAIPLAILLPLLLSLTRAYVVSTGLLTGLYASAVAVSFICFSVSCLILLMAWRINHLESEVRELLLRRSQEQLQESEQRYSELVEQAITGFVVRRPDGQLILVNEAYRSMTGYSREELLTLKARDLVIDAGVLDKVARLQPGESTRIETLLKRKDGTLLEVQYVTQRLRNGNLQSVLLDISERKRAEKARVMSEQRYTELVDQALEGITVRTPTGEFVFVNDTFCSMLGYTHAELLHMRITDVVHPEDAETTRQVQRLNSGGSLRLEKRMRRKDGRVVHVEVSARKLHDGNFQSTVQDVTERKEAELRSQVYMEELRQMSQRLLEAQETERRAIARELHDEIGQALTATRMNLRDLEQQAGDGPLKQRAADASVIVAQLLQQVRQLSLDLHPTVLDDLGLAAALRWLIRTRLGGSELSVTQELTEDLPRYASSVEHTVFRVFQEALSNVLRHSGAGNLSVKLGLQGDRLLLEVRDDGHGFDPGAARKHALAGASLGVIGMHERVRLADGHIVIESSPGQGTLVRVSLPAVER